MPYTVEDIVGAFHANLPEGTSAEPPSTLAAWINEAQEVIAREYGPVSSVSFANAKANNELELPADYMVTAAVKRVGGHEPYLKYSITEHGFVAFEDDGDYTIHYHRVPSPIPANNPEAIPEVHHSFHPLFHMYLLHKYYSKEPESGFGEDRWAEVYRIRFLEALAVTVSNLKGRARISRRIRRI